MYHIKAIKKLHGPDFALISCHNTTFHLRVTILTRCTPWHFACDQLVPLQIFGLIRLESGLLFKALILSAPAITAQYNCNQLQNLSPKMHDENCNIRSQN